MARLSEKAELVMSRLNQIAQGFLKATKDEITNGEITLDEKQEIAKTICIRSVRRQVENKVISQEEAKYIVKYIVKCLDKTIQERVGA